MLGKCIHIGSIADGEPQQNTDQQHWFPALSWSGAQNGVNSQLPSHQWIKITDQPRDNIGDTVTKGLGEFVKCLGVKHNTGIVSIVLLDSQLRQLSLARQRLFEDPTFKLDILEATVRPVETNAKRCNHSPESCFISAANMLGTCHGIFQATHFNDCNQALRLPLNIRGSFSELRILISFRIAHNAPQSVSFLYLPAFLKSSLSVVSLGITSSWFFFIPLACFTYI